MQRREESSMLIQRLCPRKQFQSTLRIVIFTWKEVESYDTDQKIKVNGLIKNSEETEGNADGKLIV